MSINSTDYASLDFVKNHNNVFYELLRLARVSTPESEINSPADKQAAIEVLNQLPEYVSVHKRIIPLLNAKAHKLEIFEHLLPITQKTLSTYTQQGTVTEIAKKQQLNKIVDKLAAHNVPLILLKGAAFAGVLYSADAPRTSNDLDVLIRKEDWTKTVSLIGELMEYTQKPQPEVFGDLYELSYLPKETVGAALDLHVSLINPLLFKISESELWENSVNHPSYNSNLVKMLSPEHALIHQALHAYKDMDFSKYNLVDTYELINSLNLDIQQAITISLSWGAGNPLYVLLKNYIEVMEVKTEAKKRAESILRTKNLKPNILIYKLTNMLLKSRFTQPYSNCKTLKYRTTQVLAQFIFTGSVKRPFSLQWLFLRSIGKKRKASQLK